MAFNWNNYIDVATHLHDTLDSEASFRSGVSRAYYSVFGRSKLLCLNTLHLISRSDSQSAKCHTLIPTVLINHEDEDLQEIGMMIETIKARRIEADYDPFSRNFTKDFLSDTIELGRQIIEIIDTY